MSVAGLHIVHTGASSYLAPQTNPRACLGGYFSTTRVRVFEPYLWAPHILGLRVDYAGGRSVFGTGYISAVTENQLVYTPSNDAAGAPVTIAVGETQTLYGADGDQWLEVTRTSSDPLRGRMPVSLRPVYWNAIAGRDWTNAERVAATPIYSLLGLYSASAAATNVKVWLGSDSDAIGWKSWSNGGVSVILSDVSAPSGVTFSSPTTEAGAITQADMPAGSHIGLAIRRTPPADATAIDEITLYLKYTVAGHTYTTYYRGRNRCDGVAYYELYTGNVDGGPIDADDPGSYSDVSNFGGTEASGPPLSDGITYLGVRRVNKWGLAGPLFQNSIRVADGAQAPIPTTAPSQQIISQREGGYWHVDAAYYPAEDGVTDADRLAARANLWRIRFTADGSDPADAEPIEAAWMGAANTALASGARSMLSYTSDSAYMDGTVIRALVSTARKVTDEVLAESEPGEELTLTIDRIGANRPDVRTFAGKNVALTLPAIAAPGSTIIDAGTTSRWEMYGNSTILRIGGMCVLRALLNNTGVVVYVPSELDLIEGDVSGSPSVEPVEVVSSTLAYISVNGARVAEIDITSGTFTINGQLRETETLDIHPAAPAWMRYAQTTIQVWNSVTDIEDVALHFAANGDMVTGGTFNNYLSESDIEALEAIYYG